MAETRDARKGRVNGPPLSPSVGDLPVGSLGVRVVVLGDCHGAVVNPQRTRRETLMPSSYTIASDLSFEVSQRQRCDPERVPSLAHPSRECVIPRLDLNQMFSADDFCWPREEPIRVRKER